MYAHKKRAPDDVGALAMGREKEIVIVKSFIRQRCSGSLEPEAQSSQEIESLGRITYVVLVLLVQQIVYLCIDRYSFEYIVAGSEMQIVHIRHEWGYCFLFAPDVIVSDIHPEGGDRVEKE